MTNDNLTCGNCGYDGGRKHLEEKLKWQEKLSKAEERSENTIQAKYFATGTTIVLSFFIMCAAYCGTKPPNTVSDSVQASNALKEMYENCMQTATHTDINTGIRSLNSEVVKSCNETFKSKIDDMKMPQP